MAAKRVFDFVIATLALLITSPLLLAVAAAIWLQDFHNPLYIANRVGRGHRLFRMVKFRSMVVNADRTGVTSTSATDKRVTAVGHFVRRCKLDEVVQLWNVARGDMSLVGPRPNVPSGVQVYTDAEKRLLSVRPGITDIASIVFADEGDILRGHADPDLAYDQLIRPWKSRLGLFYIDNRSLLLDVRLVALTVLAIVSRQAALVRVSRILVALGAPADLAQVTLRRDALVPALPPGAELAAGSPANA
jgi:lipopolysaccharide/colanic/teichoic acid biosynthesis glycosyltransferase